MLYPNTKVQWIDVKSQEAFTDTISKMFQMYSHRAVKTGDVLEVTFDPNIELVKITDMNGWTDVKAIRRIENSTQWMAIGAANQQIRLTKDTLIPIYKSNAPFQGFHGETKYPYVSKELSAIEQDDMIRIRRGINKDGEDVEFTTILVSSNDLNFVEFNHGYDVATKSGFFNADNIHLLGKDNSNA